MILDERTEFCDATALNTGAAGSYLIGDVVDLGASTPGRDLGGDMALYLVVSVDTTATSGGAATGQFNLVTDDNASLTSPTVITSSRAWPVASMTAGTTLMAIQLPQEGTAYERYIGIQQVTGTAAFTAGKVNAFLVDDVARWKAYDSPSQA
jgi:hypothetical protein